ncbi:cation diffusion facilitator family transporter [candidate division MSBL1 archaeon SCGC-AAA259E17]|uniref:Cation diffusion facilitator family transporter n=1 Tax=candidate division MSBL1 archaeon SCGC-AAA259E17 TaxID=1698263 RepID=A0A133UD31_9EURY|nr:cation diffusion facilitator family transporter [candidate division MSBL1 archaeon SCGC-AAA259E17]
MEDEKRKDFSKVSWANIAGNVAKMVAEGSAGLLFGSMALLADAAHSVGDLAASIVVLVGGRESFSAPDERHPHGHQRIGPLSALFVGAVIIVLGLNLAYESARGLLFGPEVTFSFLLLGALMFSIADMYVVFRYTERKNESIKSPSLKALAVDCQNDVYTSIAAVAGASGVYLGFPILDPLAGGLISLLVIYQGVDIARENVNYLLGASPPEEKRSAIFEAVKSHPKVRNVSELKAYYEGNSIEVEITVGIEGKVSASDIHDIESEIVEKVMKVEGVCDVHVHLDLIG